MQNGIVNQENVKSLNKTYVIKKPVIYMVEKNRKFSITNLNIRNNTTVRYVVRLHKKNISPLIIKYIVNSAKRITHLTFLPIFPPPTTLYVYLPICLLFMTLPT